MGSMAASFAPQIIGGLAGSLLGGRNASTSSRAMEEAYRKSNEGFDMAKPYIKRLYEDGAAALDDILDAGYYQGATYAGLTPRQREAAERLSEFGLGNLGFGAEFTNLGRGFGQNFVDLYNRAAGDSLATARDYALNNAAPLVDAAMRDSRRQLEESTLPTINTAASMAGNTNSSRAGVAEALARRAFDDRQADVTAEIQDRLMGRALSQGNTDFNNMNTANTNLQRLFGIGMDITPAALEQVQIGDGILRTNAQNELDASRAFFEGNRDFNFDTLNAFGSGILGQAPRNAAAATPNYFDPVMGALSGGTAGLGAGMRLSNLLSQSSPSAAVSPTVMMGYNGGFNPLALNSAFTGGMI